MAAMACGSGRRAREEIEGGGLGEGAQSSRGPLKAAAGRSPPVMFEAKQAQGPRGPPGREAYRDSRTRRRSGTVEAVPHTASARRQFHRGQFPQSAGRLTENCFSRTNNRQDPLPPPTKSAWARSPTHDSGSAVHDPPCRAKPPASSIFRRSSCHAPVAMSNSSPGPLVRSCSHGGMGCTLRPGLLSVPCRTIRLFIRLEIRCGWCFCSPTAHPATPRR
jgi:hypothetical protein